MDREGESQLGWVYPEVGRRIRETREGRGLTQEGLASLVSLTRTSITNIEKGRQRLLLHTLFEIADALKVPPAVLLPSEDGSARMVEGLIAERPRDEQDWIRSALAAVHEKE